MATLAYRLFDEIRSAFAHGLPRIRTSDSSSNIGTSLPLLRTARRFGADMPGNSRSTISNFLQAAGPTTGWPDSALSKLSRSTPTFCRSDFQGRARHRIRVDHADDGQGLLRGRNSRWHLGEQQGDPRSSPISRGLGRCMGAGSRQEACGASFHRCTVRGDCGFIRRCEWFATPAALQHPPVQSSVRSTSSTMPERGRRAVGLHLFHDPARVDLDHALAEVEVAGDHLVGLARHDEVQHFFRAGSGIRAASG